MEKKKLSFQLVTAGGKNVAPVPIEDRIKSTLKGVASNVVVVGDRKKFLSTLLTLRVNVDPATLQPTDQLTDEVNSSLIAPFTTYTTYCPQVSMVAIGHFLH